MAQSPTFDIDTLRACQEALRRQGRLHAGHWIIVGLSVAITLCAWNTSRSALEERSRSRFRSESERVVALVRERLERYEDALLSSVAAIEAGGDMDREWWRPYAAHLNLVERYPGASGIGLIHRMPADELKAHVERRRLERTVSGYTARSERAFGNHLPVAYVAPEADTVAAIGPDVAFEGNRRTAALRARRLGTTQMSGPVVLVHDTGRTSGFLLYAPYRESPGRGRASRGGDAAADREGRFRGLVHVPLVVRDLVAGVLERDRRKVSFSIRDGEGRLYAESGSKGETASAATFSRTERLSMFGRVWTFDIYSDPDFGQALGTNQPQIVLFGGLTVDAMLLMLFALMSRSNRRVLRLAERQTGDLSSRARALADTNRDLESFARVVSHDLKTPLRGIHDLADFLEEDLGDYFASDGADPGVAHNLARLREQARRGSTLIAGILDYSVAGLEQEARSRVDSREVIESIGESLRLRPGQLVVDGELPVFHTHEVRFGQVLANLIGNAVKYNSDTEGAVTRVSAERRGDFFRFSVTDNGPGIDPRFHERVFEAFATLGCDAGTGTDSSGIGLSIVKRAVERLGGTIELDSEPGRGSTFRFTWPADLGEVATRQAA